MADGDRSFSEKGTPGKTTAKATPESPTTARELDFDDDVQDAPSTDAINAPQVNVTDGGEPGPPKPPRPVNSLQQAETTLREAFPSIDSAVVRAVLTASGGRVEPAFNALLGMSDPTAVQAEPEVLSLPPPPRTTSRSPQPKHTLTSTAQSQLEADEMYARQLAEHYSGSTMRSSPRGGPPMPRPRQQTGLKPSELYEDGHSFVNDDLPIIKENLRKGFLETQSKVNRWIGDLKKRIDGEEDAGSTNSYFAAPAQTRQSSGNSTSNDFVRRSADRDRYDADPRVLSDDFGGLGLRADEAPRRSTRPLANPDLFKPTPAMPASARKVSFQAGPPEDIDAGLRSVSPQPRSALRIASPGGGGKQSKWEPLSTVNPTPVADHDPFSLGDSEDDKDVKSKDILTEDSEKSKSAAAEAITHDNKGGFGRKSEGHELVGTKDRKVGDVVDEKS